MKKFLSSYPELVKEWHPTKNGDLKPEDFTLGSIKKVWWLCPEGHEYLSVIGNRAKKNKPTGCPYCSGNQVGEDNNLLVLFPDVAKEWHPTKNGDLKPEDFTFGSGKKVWWLCPKGHEYHSVIASRAKKDKPTGCAECSGQKVGEDNNLLVLFPDVAKEWHPTKNGDLTPKDFTFGSGKKVWWKCNKGHEYLSGIVRRTRKGMLGGCPYCSGSQVGEDNNLLVLFPDVAKEWHPTKNGDLIPKEVTYGSRKKVWWLCPKGHNYKSSIANRTNKKNPTGCPGCSPQSSEPEIRILSELKWFFDEVISRYKIDGVEVDIFLPSYNLGIEYDGSYWHKDKEGSDLRKNKFLLSQNINLIRVREHPLKPLCEYDVVVGNNGLEKTDLDKILKNIFPFVEDRIKEKINTYVVKSSFVNQELFQEYRSYFPSPFPENSLLKTHPLISSEWDYKKNYPLRPENFSYGSSNKVWWSCPKGHAYESRISHRSEGPKSGCPYCSGNKVGEDNNLLVLFPDVAKEWHPTKNGKLTPKEVTSGTNKKVWWLCPKGHEYHSVIASRAKKDKSSGCPYCSGLKVGEDNNLLVLFPDVAKEWHPTKNGDLTPKDFSPGSGKKVWWLCPKGHEYHSVIANITKKDKPTGCAECSGQKVGEDNNLLVLFPDVAKEWHPTKNGDLTPKDFTPGSGKNVWWLCPKGHEYDLSIRYRTKKKREGLPCPYCSGLKVGEDNNLLVLLPDVAKEWHPTKNGDLTPKDFTPGSGKKVWWLCPKGHEYDLSIRYRTKKKREGLPCPYCPWNQVVEDNNLLVLLPDVAKEWHPTKNGDLKPEYFTYGSGKKVWWKCNKGHEWETRINKRTRKERPTGCPYCSGRKKVGALVE